MFPHQRSSKFAFKDSVAVASAKWSAILLVLILFCLVTGQVGATNRPQAASPPETITDGALNVLAQSACLEDSSRGNCVTSDQEPAYSYEQRQQRPLESSDATTTIKGPEYVEDRLSARDQVIFKSRDASHWHASDQDTLKQVLFIHRHGDRTPINFPSKDELASEPFWQFHGLGQLTNRGKKRLWLLGLVIRNRYNKFLQGSVNKNSRKSRSSGSLRCIESAQVFLASFLALDSPNSPDAQSLVWDQGGEGLSQIWQPASVNTLAAEFDGMLNEGSRCNILDAEFSALDESDESKQLAVEFRHEAEVMKRELNFDMDHFYKWFWASSLIEVERSYFANKMNPAILAVYDQLQKAGDRALVLYVSTLKLRRARVGLLINDMIRNMETMRNSTREGAQATGAPFNKKFVHYSAHDINLIFLLATFDNLDRFAVRPDYASNLMIELHSDDQHSEWFIKMFYMQKVPSKPVELHIESCERGHARSRCTLEKFAELMHKYRVTSWANWMQECGNSMSDIDPYAENA